MQHERTRIFMKTHGQTRTYTHEYTYANTHIQAHIHTHTIVCTFYNNGYVKYILGTFYNNRSVILFLHFLKGHSHRAFLECILNYLINYYNLM